MKETPLTVREIEILRDYARGMKSGEIVKKRFISLKTVSEHRASLLRKSGTHTMAECVLWAKKEGLLIGD